LGRKLIEAEIREQKAFLHGLAELLRPWWQHLGTIDQLVEFLAPAGGSPFAAPLQPMLPISGEMDVSEEPMTGGDI
jgi:hypothetical protein